MISYIRKKVIKMIRTGQGFLLMEILVPMTVPIYYLPHCFIGICRSKNQVVIGPDSGLIFRLPILFFGGIYTDFLYLECCIVI